MKNTNNFKNIRFLFFFSILLVFSALLIGFLFLDQGPSLTQKIDRYLQKNAFQGAVLIAQKDAILFKKGYGFANIEHQILNSPKTVFRIGSITKQFTAVAILQLQEKGLLKVTDPIKKYIPDFPNGDKISLHHLLSHTSGIPSICEFPNLQEIQRHPSTPETVINHFRFKPLHFSPGTDCEYSDSGYILLGAIIESITGIPYERYLKEHIFDPLGMHATYYDHNSSIIPNRASGYVIKDGKYSHSGHIDMSFPFSAGALSSTVEDLFIWNRALQGTQLFSKKSYNALFTEHASSQERNCTYGYGFRVGPRNKGMVGCHASIIGHYGTIEGFEGAVIQYLDENLIIILLSNVEKTDVRTFHKNLVDLVRSSWRTSASL